MQLDSIQFRNIIVKLNRIIIIIPPESSVALSLKIVQLAKNENEKYEAIFRSVLITCTGHTIRRTNFY
jgi:regulator of extracellular matrix RemA (YlzA/DUF370 family)